MGEKVIDADQSRFERAWDLSGWTVPSILRRGLFIVIIFECVSLLLDLFFFKQKTAYEIGVRLVGSEMCIRDRIQSVFKINLTDWIIHGCLIGCMSYN